MNLQPLDDLDAFFAYIRAEEALANDQVTDAQRTIVWGSYAKTTFGDIKIFGEVWTKERNRSSCFEAGGDDEEADGEESLLEDAYQRGYRFGNWCSIACPTGELGSHHISRLTPITEAEFQAAKEAGWQ